MTVGLNLLWTGALALIVVGLVRWRVGFVAIPGMGRRPFLVVLGACWALAAIGALLPSLFHAPAVLVGVVLAGVSGLLLILRGRELEAAGLPDPLGGRRSLLVASHAIVIVGVVLLAATGRL